LVGAVLESLKFEGKNHRTICFPSFSFVNFEEATAVPVAAAAVHALTHVRACCRCGAGASARRFRYLSIRSCSVEADRRVLRVSTFCLGLCTHF